MKKFLIVLATILGLGTVVFVSQIYLFQNESVDAANSAHSLDGNLDLIAVDISDEKPILIAANGDVDPAAPLDVLATDQELLECTGKLRVELPVIQKRFLSEMETLFEGDNKNSDNIQEALDKYQQARNEMYTLYLAYSQAKDGESVSVSTARAPNCYLVVEDSYTALEQVLRKYARSTTSSKTTSQLIEKYKEINGKLSGLNMDMGRMKGYIESFEAKLPCYIEKCVR